MVLRRVATDELCKDGYTCHGVWVDDDPDIEDVVIVGEDLDPAPVPLGTGERAVRIRRQIVQSANLQGSTMEIADLARIVDGAQLSVFRLETLPQYLVPQEAEEFAAWRSGLPVALPTLETSPWLAQVAARVTSGVRWSRVHVLDHPLSDYCRYEIWGYAANQAAGEQICLADRGAHPDLESLREDFWLVDDAMAVRMIYDVQGRFEQPELVEDVRPYIVMRDTACRHAEPLDEYVASRGLEFTARSV